MTRQQAQEAQERCEAATAVWDAVEKTDIPKGHRRISEFITHAEADLPAALEMLTEAMKSLEHLKRGCANRPCVQCEAVEALLSEWGN